MPLFLVYSSLSFKPLHYHHFLKNAPRGAQGWISPFLPSLRHTTEEACRMSMRLVRPCALRQQQTARVIAPITASCTQDRHSNSCCLNGWHRILRLLSSRKTALVRSVGEGRGKLRPDAGGPPGWRVTGQERSLEAEVRSNGVCFGHTQ